MSDIDPAPKPALKGASKSRLGGTSFTMIIRTVALLYVVWVGVTVSDLALCRWRGGSCDGQMGEVKGVFTTVTVGLMGWVSDSPMAAK